MNFFKITNMKKPMNGVGVKSSVLYCFILSLISVVCFSQDNKSERIIDEVIGVVGNEIILKSEIELQSLSQNPSIVQAYSTEELTCVVFEDLLIQKLLLNQAKVDSIEISPDQIESEIDRRMRYFINQIGSEQKLEEYYGKSLLEIKDEFRDMVENQLLVQKMQSKMTENTKVTPSEVRSYFENIPEDSLPYINSEIEVAQIVCKPPISNDEKDRVKNKLLDIRKRIINGEDFGTLAYLYSEDPLSAQKNGELGFVQRGALVPEFEGVAFKLKEGEVSNIVETQYGYHILQLIERRGDKINVRHILLVPKVSIADLNRAKLELDSLHQLILLDSISFVNAAEQVSDDEMSKLNGGVITNLQTGDTKFNADELDPIIALAVNKLKVGELSRPVLMSTQDGKQAYRLLKVNLRTDPHRASLVKDYQRIQTACLTEKQNNAVFEWVDKKLSDTYVSVGENYRGCNFSNKWVKN